MWWGRRSELCVQKYLCRGNSLEGFKVNLNTHTRTMKILPMRENLLIFWKIHLWRHRFSLTNFPLLLFYVFHATRYNVSKRNVELISAYQVENVKIIFTHKHNDDIKIELLTNTTTDCAFSWLCLFLMPHAGDVSSRVNQLVSKFQW